ncbi:MAG: TetR/AcrR family transcriptional regulator [Deltaproteobacteria bacterium]|nr:TetR/AcrR family transcriptional regulator [Deltaproteobacteria bacterium]
MGRSGDDDTPISRTRILAAARKSFESVGYRRTGIARIAREAGIAVGTVYRHFENKEDLLVAVLREINERWLEKARVISSPPGTALERIMRLAEASVAHNRENRLLNAIWTRDTDVILAPLLDDLHAWVSKGRIHPIHPRSQHFRPARLPLFGAGPDDDRHHAQWHRKAGLKAAAMPLRRHPMLPPALIEP